MNEKIILGFPGPWETRESVVGSIFDKFGGNVVYSDNVLRIPERNLSAEMFIYDFDENIRATFEYAGKGKMSDYVLNKVAMHKHTIYLKIERGGNDLKESLLLFSEIISTIGAFAVKVETSGIAFEIAEWMKNMKSEDHFTLYSSLVTLIKSEKFYYSCGMQNFGLPDCCVNKEVGLKDSAYLLNSLNVYQIKEKPEFNTGQVFSVDEDGPQYRMELKEDFILGGEPFFVNSLGRWVLERVGS